LQALRMSTPFETHDNHQLTHNAGQKGH
jgi:hypothetical protein